MEGLYNVYAWRWRPDGGSTPAVRVLEGVPISEATIGVEAYLNRTDGEWDAYLVEQSDDPGWTPPKENKPDKGFLDFVKEVEMFWGDSMPRMCVEELSELTKAICKCERYDKDDRSVEKVIDEMGDVLISVWALAHHYGISKQDIGKRVKEKMDKSY